MNREIEHWVATKSPDRILPVVTDGDWQWDAAARDFTPDSTAVPHALRGVFTEEPLYLDLRWARDDQHLSLRHSRFRDAIAQLAAPMHGVSKDDLEGEDVRQHRRARRLWSFGVSALMLLTFVAVLTGLLALHNADRANASAQEARRQEKIALEQRGSAERSAEEANRQEEVARSQELRAEQAAAEVRRQEALATEQKSIAAKASTTAERQQANARYQRALADKAAARARQQEILAQQQRTAAQRAAAETRRQERNAREQQKKAAEQERRATEAAAEARRQEKKAREQEKKADEATRETGRQTQIAISRRLLNQAKATVDSDPTTALKLGLAAESVRPDPETRSALAGLVASTTFAGSLDAAGAVAHGPGGLLVLVDPKGTVRLWDVTDRADPKPLSTIDNVLTSTFGLFVSMSPDGRTIAFPGENQAAQVWDVSEPTSPAKLGEVPGATSVVFSPDGHTVGAVVEDTAVLYDTTDWAEPRRLAALPEAEYHAFVGFSKDGLTAVTAGAEPATYDISDPADPKKLATVPATSTSTVAYNAAQSLLATDDGNGQVTFWNLTDPAEPVEDRRRWLTTGSPAALMTFSPDGNFLAASDAAGNVTLWSLSGPASPVRLHTVPPQWAPTAITFSGDENTVIVAAGSGTTMWNVAVPGAPQPAAALPAHPKPVRLLAYRPDGRTLVTVHSDGMAVFWDVRRADQPVKRTAVRVSDKPIRTAALSPDGLTLAVSDRVGALSLVNVSDPEKPVTLGSDAEPMDEWGGTSMVFSPDGRTLARFGYAKLMLWRVTKAGVPERAGMLEGPLFTGDQAAFSPDGKTLALTGHPGLTLVDVTDPATPKTLVEVGGTKLRPLSAAFSPDGSILAVGDHNREVTLWDVTNRAQPHRFATLPNHVGGVGSLAFGPDGRTLAAGIQDRTVMLWDITDRNAPVRFPAAKHNRGQTGMLVFNPKGGTLAAGGDYYRLDTSVSLWDYSSLNALRADPAKHACAIAGSSLTNEEWSRYVPELRYRRSCTD
ncbi:WD40 repeat protein [Spirilliplanes yamanashiensis]|nr:WD40 repeat protein [Spirilliplanes yamanashiensis]